MRLAKTTALVLLLALFTNASEMEAADEQEAMEEMEENPDVVEVGTFCQTNQPLEQES